MTTLALDIGGANIKAAHSDGRAWSVPFALWQQPSALCEGLRRHVGNRPNADELLVTMTGELCDCFETRADGVLSILRSVKQWATNTPTGVWSITEGSFIACDAANDNPLAVASANWHALATFVASKHPKERGMLIDIGSTTTDIIWLEQGVPKAMGMNDRDRLASGELVYTGVHRTPIAAVTQNIAWQNQTCGVAAESFAFMSDVYTLLDDIPESQADTDTADGKPRTRFHCANRMLRMIGSDMGINTAADAQELAAIVAATQCDRIVEAARKVIFRNTMSNEQMPYASFFLSGSGEFLAGRVAKAVNANASFFSLSRSISPEASSAACAYALLQLRRSECNHD